MALLLFPLVICVLLFVAGNVTMYTDVPQQNIINIGQIKVNGEMRPISQLTTSYVLNVVDYGAKSNDSTFDNTDSFQKALNASLSIGGCIVYVPAGHWYFKGVITIPMGVSLIGTYLTAPVHSKPANIEAITDGSVLAPTYGKGMQYNNSSASFITMQQQSTMKGFVIFYPDQMCVDKTPPTYPPTIYMSASDITISDIELLNSYVGVNATHAGRHFIARITGQPIYVGIYIDAVYDIGRVENVQFKSNFCHEPSYWKIQQFYGTSFVIGRTDWQYMFNTFSWGYSTGYHFISTAAGSPSGNFLGIGSDACNNYSVKIDSVKPWGIVITNGEFVAMRNTELNSTSIPVVVDINENANGSIQFVNCIFWGANQYIASINKNAQVGFSNCEMQTWDNIYKNHSAAIQVKNGVVKLIGNNFFIDKPQCYFHKGTRKGIAIGNTVAGNVQFEQDSGVNVTIIGNM